MQLFNDILDFLKSLSFVDYVFFFAVLVLMILVVTLFYFIRINDDLFVNKDDAKKQEETQEMKIVEEINKTLSNNPVTEDNNITFTDYEKDQEEKAIISYDELVKKDNNYALNYEKEEFLDDLSVKKFDLDNLVNKQATSGEKVNPSYHAISLEKEEEFLKALKQLQQALR